MKNERLIEKLEITLQVLFFLWAIILPWSTAGMQIFLGLLIFASIMLSVFTHNSPVQYHPFYIFLAVYIISNLTSAINSDNWQASIGSVFANDWTILSIPFLICAPIRPHWRKKAFQGLLISAGIVGMIGIIQSLSGSDFLKGYALTPQGNYYRAIGTYSSFLTFGGNQLFAFAVGFAFLSYYKSWKLKKNIILFSTILIFFSIIASFSRSTWIAALAVFFIGTLFIYRKNFLYVIGGFIVVGLISSYFVPDLYTRFLSIFSPSQNEGRLTLWATSWEIIKDNLLLGIGNGNFPKYFLIYKVPGFYDAFSHAHNDFINVTVINGIIGLITWVAVWVAWFYYAIKGYNNIEEIEADKQIMLSAILGITGILIAAQFQCFYTDLENNIFWWFLASTALQIGIQNKKKSL